MNSMKAVAPALGVVAVAWLFFAVPATAQYPDPECDPTLAAANGDQTGLLEYCDPDGEHPDADCDLEITAWEETTFRSPDLRIGDPFGPDDPRPRFFLDVGDEDDPSDDRLYTKLYVKFRNAGGGLGAGGYAPADEVTVAFSFKEVTGPPANTDVYDSTGWQEAGTPLATGIDNIYRMNIPATSPPTIGALVPGDWHFQQRPVCWVLPNDPATDLPQVPKRFILKAEVIWPQEANQPDDAEDANDIACTYYDLTTLGRKAQIGFAFDLSGSMASAFEATTRIAEAKEKAALFTSLVEDGNELGVFGFSTDNTDNSSFTTSYNNPPTPPVILEDTSEIAPMQTITGDFQRGTIAGQISAQDPHGCTPLGQGLLRARKAIHDTPPPDLESAEAIVLFSDGLTNIPPAIDGPLLWTCRSTPAADAIDTGETFSDEGIQIYSVYFGPEMGWGWDLMNELKNQTGGDYVYGAASAVELAAAYYSIRALVDDMVYFDEDGTTSASGPWPTFEVELDAGTGTATAAIAWPLGSGDTRLTLDRRPKGAVEWQPCAKPRIQDTSVGEASFLPRPFEPRSFEVCRFDPGADSTWELRVRKVAPQEGSTRYTAAVFAEVQEAQIFASLDDIGFETGDPLPISAELRTAGRPFLGATVTAQVQVPDRPFSTTLYKYSNRLKGLPADADASRVSAMAARLGKLLAQDVGSDALYVYRDVLVTLSDDGQGTDRVAGDGIYSGVLPGTETRIAGDYRVTVTARVTLTGGRSVERVARLSTICDVGPADPDRSLVKVNVSADPRGDVRAATVTVVPFDRFGNAAFPGSGRSIAIIPINATLRGNLLDNLDTTYTQTLVLENERAEVRVAVGGVSLGGFPIGPPKRAKREASFHLGVASPHGTFGTLYSSGESFGVDHAWWLDAGFAVKAELDLDRFGGAAGGSRDLFSLSSYLQHRWSHGPWDPYFELGVGFYDLENDGSALGFAAGLGAHRELSPRWSLDLNLQGHRVGGGLDLSFSRIRIGAILKY